MDKCGAVLTMIDEWDMWGDEQGEPAMVGLVAFVCLQPCGHDPPCEMTGVNREGDRVTATWRIAWIEE